MTDKKQGTVNRHTQFLPTEFEILNYLSKDKGRAVDIAKATDYNQKTVWEALDRLTKNNLVTKDRFGIYEITKEGKGELEDARGSSDTMKNVKIAKLSRMLKDEISNEKEIDEILKMTTNYLEKKKKDQ